MIFLPMYRSKYRIGLVYLTWPKADGSGNRFRRYLFAHGYRAAMDRRRRASAGVDFSNLGMACSPETPPFRSILSPIAK